MGGTRRNKREEDEFIGSERRREEGKGKRRERKVK